jgi:UDP-glucose 4-epimerase
VGKVVFASSGGTVYGAPPATAPILETSQTNPTTSYGIVKLAIEKYLDLYYRQSGLNYIVLRASNAYGERQNLQRSQGAIGVFMNLMQQARQIELWGDGQIVRDYVYVGDLARAFRLAAESSVPCGTFNVGSGEGLSLNQLIDELRAITGIDPSISYLPARPFDVPSNVLNIDLVKSTLGWEPSTTLRQGLSRTWEWFQSLK